MSSLSPPLSLSILDYLLVILRFIPASLFSLPVLCCQSPYWPSNSCLTLFRSIFHTVATIHFLKHKSDCYSPAYNSSLIIQQPLGLIQTHDLALTYLSMFKFNIPWLSSIISVTKLLNLTIREVSLLSLPEHHFPRASPHASFSTACLREALP